MLPTLSQRINVLVLALCSCFVLSAQVTIIPHQKGGNIFHIDQLFQLMLINNSHEVVSGQLEVILTKRTGEQLLQTTSLPLSLNPGMATRSRQLQWPNGIGFGSGVTAQMLQTTGQLPYGEFGLCYYFRQQVNNEVIGEYCGEFTVQLAGKPALIYPLDQSRISQKRPILQWRPPGILQGTSLSYHLKICELYKDQSAIVALNTNAPLINRSQLSQTNLVYPLEAPKLEIGKEYVWQVDVYLGQTLAGSTDIWTFAVDDLASTYKSQPQSSPESYALLDPKIGGSTYLSRGAINFTFQNHLGSSNLEYAIYPEDNNSEAIPGLPLIPIKPGWNKVSLNSSQLSGLQHGKYYLLEVIDNWDRKKYLKFKFIRE